MIMDKFTKQFFEDVVHGLSAGNKYLPSKYFYDEQGDALFSRITELEEYYLTRSELEILDTQKERILDYFCDGCPLFHLIELGAGDGSKTRILLDHFVNQRANLIYHPIDISGNILDILENRLKEEIPGLNIESIHGEYLRAFRNLTEKDPGKKVLMFLGSSIGNMNHPQAVEFLKKIRNELHAGDLLFIGFDLQKDPSTILSAYNDKQGVTARFNLNLLERINKELNGNFTPENFYHYACYDPLSGQARSYLVSTRKQQVQIGRHPEVFYFEEGEAVFTEVSQKYDLKMIDQLARESGFITATRLYDSKKYFVDVIWRVN